jgi:hypothetical protein
MTNDNARIAGSNVLKAFALSILIAIPFSTEAELHGKILMVDVSFGS